MTTKKQRLKETNARLFSTPPKTFKDQVLQELRAMKAVGMTVPTKAFELACEDKGMDEYEDNGLSVTDTATLLVELVNLTGGR
jgi:hypothetical protein